MSQKKGITLSSKRGYGTNSSELLGNVLIVRILFNNGPNYPGRASFPWMSSNKGWTSRCNKCFNVVYCTKCGVEFESQTVSSNYMILWYWPIKIKTIAKMVFSCIRTTNNMVGVPLIDPGEMNWLIKCLLIITF